MFYRARLSSAGDSDFRIPATGAATEALWLSKDPDFTGVFSGDAMDLVPQFIARDSSGREFLEVEGVRLGFAQVGLVLDPERAMETARTREFEWNSGWVQFLVADPVTLYLEKQALVLRRGQPGDRLHLEMLHDFVAWEATVAAESLLQRSADLSVAESRDALTLLTDAGRRTPEILRDPRMRRRVQAIEGTSAELRTTVDRILSEAD